MADTETPFARPQPLHIGVGGDYPNGIDGQLSARGYPWERIFAWELNDPETLRKYDVILLSCIPEALIEWIKAGGRAYVETWAAQSRFPLRSLVKISSGAPSKGDVMLTLPSHPIAAGQWYRLGIRLRDETVEAILDGDTVLSSASPEVRGGGVGVLVRGGSARFDDVILGASSDPLRTPHDEGSPAAEPPPSLGPHDTLTWASPATPWVADPECPSALWHDGFFPGDLDVALRVEPVTEPALVRFIFSPSTSAPEHEHLSLALRLSPDSPKAEIVLQRRGRKPAVKRVPLRDESTLEISRRSGKLTVLWCGAPAFRADGTERHSRVGMEVFGPPVQAKDICVRGAGTYDYVFGVAPTDWWVSAGEWEVSARWACDDRWSWLAGWGRNDAAIWNKRRFDGDVVIDFYVGVKMNAPGGREIDRCRDYNTVICGDRNDPRSGYSFIIGGDGGVKTQLLRNGEVVAESPDVRVADNYNVHHRWFRVRASRIGNLISCDFEGRPVFRYEDPEPLPGGHVGLWTRNSGILAPRVTIWSSG